MSGRLVVNIIKVLQLSEEEEHFSRSQVRPARSPPSYNFVNHKGSLVFQRGICKVDLTTIILLVKTTIFLCKSNVVNRKGLIFILLSHIHNSI